MSVVDWNKVVYLQEYKAMKIGNRRLKMSSGEIRTFKSKGARDRFERVAQAVKHGFKPGKKRRKR